MIKKLHIKESTQYNVLPDRYIKAVKKAVGIINKWIEDESEYLPDLLMRGSNTYNFASEYIKDDWTLDVDMILNDWDESEEEFQADYGAHSLSGTWDPRDYLFNILRELLGYSYENAEKLLAYK